MPTLEPMTRTIFVPCPVTDCAEDVPVEVILRWGLVEPDTITLRVQPQRILPVALAHLASAHLSGPPGTGPEYFHG